jgi:tellurite resistance protein TehA-like permease
MVLATGLESHAYGAAEVAFVVFFTATILFGGLIYGQWIIRRVDKDEFHPGYVLPTVAGGLVAAGGAAGFELRALGWLAFGIGTVCWLVFTSLTLDRLLLIEMVPAALAPYRAPGGPGNLLSAYPRGHQPADRCDRRSVAGSDRPRPVPGVVTGRAAG